MVTAGAFAVGFWDGTSHWTLYHLLRWTLGRKYHGFGHSERGKPSARHSLTVAVANEAIVIGDSFKILWANFTALGFASAVGFCPLGTKREGQGCCRPSNLPIGYLSSSPAMPA
ncbi:hypothetical protein ACOSQ3_011630 [Xanthoceras sorbifolium]